MLILKNAKIVIESDLRANVSFLALMNVSSRCWSPFHANECVFSRNEQQKVYCTLKYANMIRISNISFFRFCWKNGKLDWPKCARTRGYYLCYLMSCDDSSLFRCVTRIQEINFFRSIIYLTRQFDEHFWSYALFIFAWLIQVKCQEFDDNVCVL